MGGGRWNEKRWEVGDGMRKGRGWEIGDERWEVGDGIRKKRNRRPYCNKFFPFTSFMLQEHKQFLLT